MRKKLIFSISLVLFLGLAACGEENVKEEETPKEEMQKPASTDNESEGAADNSATEESNGVGDTTESELGKLTVLYKDKELNRTVNNGPVNATLDKIQLATLEPSESYKESFDGQDKVTVVTIEASAENTVDNTINYYLNQAKLVTDTGQQVNADIWFSDDIGGEFLGKVKKNGNIIWILKHDEAVKKVTLHITGASNDTFDHIGEDLKVEIPLDK
ncbi:hypothetical protein I6G82_07395 [Lysinibacillus macroides]|uniref:Lipoprotein n=1 Tax=Lysinibacillus macroides TaxID=33935 RepID=A0A0M9DKY3_9BACI|nr:hypothetical protein [Lysinibacillus macroides]KOY83538.1 hypothetical protein ADM90_09895 [Lysinibacillus macroides]QPR69416.1 hypothetical protein I6G82_07395 [Lysinibacillus macroides]